MCEQHWFCCYCLAHTCGGYFSLLHVQSSGWFGAGFQTKEKNAQITRKQCQRLPSFCHYVCSKPWWWFEIPVFTEGIIIYALDSKSGCRSSFSFTESTQESIVNLERLTKMLYLWTVQYIYYHYIYTVYKLFIYMYIYIYIYIYINTLPFKRLG